MSLPSRHTTLFHCYKVNFRSRRWTTNFQRWNNVIDFNIGQTTNFQRCFNVRFQCSNNVRFQRWNNVIFQHWNNVIFQRWFVLIQSNVFSKLKFDVVSTCICLLGLPSSLKSVAYFSFFGVRNVKAVECLFVFFFYTKIRFVTFLCDGKKSFSNC